jgi:5-methylcytosine-specific restriction endonuclease McrA
MRHEFSARTKALAFERCAGHCEGCTRKLLAGDFHYDHEIPDGIGGEAVLENCRVLCRSCHAIKTPKDITRIAKAKRNRRKAAGIRKPSTMPGSRNSPWKKTFSQGWVKR